MRGKPERMDEYMKSHGAKSTKFVRAKGCEHGTDAALAKKNDF